MLLLLLLLLLLGGAAAGSVLSSFAALSLYGLRKVPLPASCPPFGAGSSRTPSPASRCPLSAAGSTGASPTASCPPSGSGSAGAPRESPAKKAKKRAPAKPRVRTPRPPSHSGHYGRGARKGKWDSATFLAGQAKAEKVLEPVEDDLQWENRRCAALDGAEEEAAAMLNQLRLVRGLIQQVCQLGLVSRRSANLLLDSLMPAAPLPP